MGKIKTQSKPAEILKKRDNALSSKKLDAGKSSVASKEAKIDFSGLNDDLDDFSVPRDDEKEISDKIKQKLVNKVKFKATKKLNKEAANSTFTKVRILVAINSCLSKNPRTRR